ncbi:hypothetical protein [Haloplanus halophilus]|uniref:hypothetical protein n=1 Tax=Haloplanus halophilus TaxID=2949993 RepID=UPI0020412685|nr:hypothetical protein [Haloplanus sp. GDY1]
MASETGPNGDENGQLKIDVGTELYDACIEPTYQLNRSGAHDGREQHHLHLRGNVSRGFEEIHHKLSSGFDQKVYKADTGELLIMLALRHIDELPEVAADVGFGISPEEAVTKAREG